MCRHIVGSGVKPLAFSLRHPFNWKFLTPTLLTIYFTFVHLLLVHTVLYIKNWFCPLPLPQVYKMLSNLLKEKDLHRFYFVPTLFIDPHFLVKKCQPPPFNQFSKSQLAPFKKRGLPTVRHLFRFHTCILIQLTIKTHIYVTVNLDELAYIGL